MISLSFLSQWSIVLCVLLFPKVGIILCLCYTSGIYIKKKKEESNDGQWGIFAIKFHQGFGDITKSELILKDNDWIWRRNKLHTQHYVYY